MAHTPTTCPICKQETIAHDETSAYCTSCLVFRQPLPWWPRQLAWASKRTPWGRLLLYFWFIVLLAQNLKDKSFALSRQTNPFSMLDFGIHELGHALFMFCGDFMHILGGSLFQCVFPLLWMIGFYQKKWYFAACMCWCWLGLNLFDVATYAADARARLLPLSIGPGALGLDDTQTDAVYDQAHDWYQILSRVGHLQSDLAIANGLRIAGAIAFIVGFIMGGILLYHMLRGFLAKWYHSN